MTDKEFIKKAFRLEEIECIHWFPIVGFHGGKLIVKDADEYLGIIKTQVSRNSLS